MSKADRHTRDKDDQHIDGDCPECQSLEMERAYEIERGFEIHNIWIEYTTIKCACGHSYYQHHSGEYHGWKDHSGCSCVEYVLDTRKSAMVENCGMGCSEGESRDEMAYERVCRDHGNALARQALREMVE